MTTTETFTIPVPVTDAVLDNPAYFALNGPQAHLAERSGTAVRYPSDVSPFAALPLPATQENWADLRQLVDGRVGVSAGVEWGAPQEWHLHAPVDGVQLSGADVVGRPDEEAIVLTHDDVPEMLALVERTKPGPFLQRTIELGTYLGIRRDGELIAMAGERMKPPGWTEVSAVCTDARFRGQGLGGRLVLAVVANIQARGDRAFLHTGRRNVNAIRLYESLGFRLRRAAQFGAIQAPV
ncbi:GNAT family N-acetyltransferase [Branchiibius sp. NY16-3462-2]|uniref:GNAT family N-acetyltransferase n=1 Tax=Branchiibius sp. NY16-3462-2 TaxID=1807500 RepID=UPI0007941D8D|nr:GNAT family N-acetyltransferase [Branchiibius sp. NY16-3462-2]KYH44943.1 GNAT family N-acetyltransferase [Branchiibius sp. NY16-3462-2]